MAFTVNLKESVIDDLRWLGEKQGRLVLREAEKRLAADPLGEARNMKTLRPNPTAQRELRLLGKYRILFNVDPAYEQVTIVLVGEKRGSSLIVQGKEFTAHESDSTQ